MQSAPSVADLSGNNHPGRLISTACGNVPDCPNRPLPQFVIDPSAPNARPVQPSVLVDSPGVVPLGARVFDSFSRNSSTYAFDNIGGLGLTEGGTAGQQVWQYAQTASPLLPFGILNGRAVALANSAAAAWVPTGSGPANLDIRVNRSWGTSAAGIATGLVFRFQDSNNFFYAYTNGISASTQTLTLGYVSSLGLATLVAGTAMPPDWTTLRVVTLESGRIDVYADATLVYSTTTGWLANGKNAGLWHFGSGQGLSNRWDNFTVLDAP